MNSSVCRIDQSCGRSAMQKNHTERCTVWVQTSERWKKGDLILQPWRGYRYKTGRVEYFGKCWSPWIFTRDCLEFTQHGARNILWAGWNTLMMMSEIGGAWPDWSESTVTRISTRYIRGELKSISEQTTHESLLANLCPESFVPCVKKLMGYNGFGSGY